MPDPLEGIRAKLARSVEHLVELDDGVHQYLDANPVGIQRQVQPDGETSVIAFVVKEQPPIELAILAGEVVHQMRSALDHLANQLVRAAGNTPTRSTSFPTARERPQKGINVPGGVGSRALQIIESLQPYHRRDQPQKHPLALLNELWNIDKHRNLALTTMKLTDSQAFISNPDGTARVGGQFQTRSLGHNDILGVFRFSDGGIPPEAEIEVGGRLFVAFADSGPWESGPVTEVLEALHGYVTTTVLGRLEALC